MVMNFALRQNGLPSLVLWERLLPHCPGLYVHEDNQAMIRVVESGRNPTMRYIGRTHGISVAWLHEQFQKEELSLAYEWSARMCADIFTKGFTEADKWKLVCSLICVINPAELGDLAQKTAEIVADPGGLLVPAKTKGQGDKDSEAGGSGAREGPGHAVRRKKTSACDVTTKTKTTAGATTTSTSSPTKTPSSTNSPTTHTHIHTN